MTAAPASHPVSARVALRGDLLDFTSTPEWGAAESAAVRFRPDHWLLIDHGQIMGTLPGDQSPDITWDHHDHRGRLILPGFIDSHVHSPQLDVIASYGTELLDWLNTYTFPAERRYADPEQALTGAARFLDALLAHGTTSAVVFPTVHKVSVDTLFAAARERGMRLIAGKVLMDRHAPDGLRDDVVQAERDCVDLIARWHGESRLAYAMTVRFAPTSTPAQLAMAGRLCAAYPDLYMQTHLAENRAEVQWVKELFPDARSYLDVYARAGLLNARSVFAHGIWLDAADRAALRDVGAQIAHSPSSNLFLGSGLFDWTAAEDAGVAVSMASDVGGGTSLSMLRTMAAAYTVGQAQHKPLSPWRAWYLATLGGAAALALDDFIGNFKTGKEADFAVFDFKATPELEWRIDHAKSIEEKLFALITLGDERCVSATHILGEKATP